MSCWIKFDTYFSARHLPANKQSDISRSEPEAVPMTRVASRLYAPEAMRDFTHETHHGVVRLGRQ